MSAIEIAVALDVEMIVGERIPGTKRRVVVTDARDIEVVGVNILLAQG